MKRNFVESPYVTLRFLKTRVHFDARGSNASTYTLRMWCQKYFRASWLAQRSIWRHIWPGLSGLGSTPGIYHFNQFLIELFWKKFIKFTSYIRIFPWHSHGSEFLRLFNRDRAKKNRQFSYYAHVILRIEKPLKNIKTIISCSKNHPTCFLKLRFFSQIMILGNKH